MSRLLNLSLIQLEYLVALDEHRHFINAAKACFVTQPTLSMQIKKLEEELGVVLFDRSKQPVIPTDIGKLIILQAREVIRETHRIDNILQSYQGTVAGDLTLGIIPTVSPYLMPQFISKLSKCYPDVRLHVKELLTDELIRMLQEDHIDLGIAATPLSVEGLIERPLFYEKFSVYLNEDHPAYQKFGLTGNDLLLDKVWLLSEGNCFRNQSINLCALKDQTKFLNNFEYESGSLETLIRIVNLEGGATVIPQWASLELRDSEKNHLRTLENADQVREISMLYTRNFVKANLVEKVFQVLRDAIPEVIKDNRKTGVVSIL